MMLPPSPISTQWSLFCRLNPLKPDSSNCYSLPSRPYLPFLNFWHSGTLALSLLTLLTRLLSAECLSARMSEINYGRLDPYGAEHSKCNHMITLGFKGLTLILNSFVFTSLRASYLARVCTDVDIPHCVVIHSVHDLHAVRTSKFWRSNANVDSIDLHAALRHLRLHRKQETQEMKHRNVTSLYFAILLRLMPLTDDFQKTEWLRFRVVSKYPQCIVWFCHKARVRDGWTDGQGILFWGFIQGILSTLALRTERQTARVSKKLRLG